MLDPTSTFLWYSVAIFGLCAIMALLADLLEKRHDRHARRQQRERARQSRQVDADDWFDPARVSGQPTEGDESSARQPDYA